jgi:hypothetical protein
MLYAEWVADWGPDGRRVVCRDGVMLVPWKTLCVAAGIDADCDPDWGTLSLNTVALASVMLCGSVHGADIDQHMIDRFAAQVLARLPLEGWTVNTLEVGAWHVWQTAWLRERGREVRRATEATPN